MRKAYAICVFLMGSVLCGFSQGSLTPPGAPGATMRTLDEIDASVTGVSNAVAQVVSRVAGGSNAVERLPVGTDVLTLPSSATAEHVITERGFYYLSGNLHASGGLGGISIEADHVTLDLCGFSVVSEGGSSNPGVYLNFTGGEGVIVRNGTVSGFDDGVYAKSTSNRVEGNSLIDNDRGLDVGTAGNFIVCNTATGNSTNYSISGMQTIGTIVTATGTIASTNPWANFEY